MVDNNLYEDCKKLSRKVYPENRHIDSNGWQYKESYSNNHNGFFAEIYTKNNKAILAIRGTELHSFSKETTKDLFNDFQMGIKLLPSQMQDAEQLYINIARKYGKNNVILTGHSLGGSEAQILGAKYGAETLTFGAYGIKNLNGVDINYTKNITNYGNAQDGIFVKNIDNQVGKTIILNTNSKNGNVFNKQFKLHSVNPHKIENLGNLSDGIEYKKEIFEDKNAPLLKIGVEYNDYDPDEIFDTKNRVLYKGEVSLDDLELGSPLFDLYIDNLVDNVVSPTKKEIDKRVRIGELIYVDEYHRADGTTVSGYYRAYPRK